jgi:hypothetical protein
VFGQHGVDLHLEAGTERDELGPLADQLAQAPQRHRGDPRLRETVEAQALQQLHAVAVVVLHPTVVPVQRSGMHQMHLRALRLEDVDRPVPAVGGLDRHLGVRSRLLDRHRQRHRIVVDAAHAELLTTPVLTDDQRPAAMQINRDVLSFHGSSPSSRQRFRSPECYTSRTPGGRGPFLHDTTGHRPPPMNG